MTVGFGRLQTARRPMGLVPVHVQRGDERILRDLDLAELAHLLLAGLLLLGLLARHVAAARALRTSPLICMLPKCQSSAGFMASS